MSSGNRQNRPYIGLTGGWLTFWITACFYFSLQVNGSLVTDRSSCSVARATDMSLFGYHQGFFQDSVSSQLLKCNWNPSPDNFL